MNESTQIQIEHEIEDDWQKIQKRGSTSTRKVFFSFLVKILNMSSRANFTNRSARIKAEHKTLMKHAPFLHKRSFGSFFYIHATRKKLPK